VGVFGESCWVPPDCHPVGGGAGQTRSFWSCFCSCFGGTTFFGLAAIFFFGFGFSSDGVATAGDCNAVAVGEPAASGGVWAPLTNSGGTPWGTPGTPSGNTGLRSPGSGFLLLKSGRRSCI